MVVADSVHLEELALLADGYDAIRTRRLLKVGEELLVPHRRAAKLRDA